MSGVCKKACCAFLAALIALALGHAAAAPYQYQMDEGIFQVRVDLPAVREFELPLHQYRLRREPLNPDEIRKALQDLGEGGLEVVTPPYTEGGLVIRRSPDRDFFPDVQGRGAPLYTGHEEAAFAQPAAKAAALLDALAWPRINRAITALGVPELAQYTQDRLGPGYLQEVDRILEMLFRTSDSTGKTFVSYQSALKGYPLAYELDLTGYQPRKEEVAGTQAAFLLGSQGELLCAFLPEPFVVEAARELPWPAVPWQAAVPQIMDRQVAHYKLFLKENRAVLPSFDAFWAQNQVTIHLRVKAVEPAWRVSAAGLALPVWQVCVETDFVYSGEEPAAVVRANMADIEETLWYVDAVTGDIFR